MVGRQARSKAESRISKERREEWEAQFCESINIYMRKFQYGYERVSKNKRKAFNGSNNSKRTTLAGNR